MEIREIYGFHFSADVGRVVCAVRERNIFTGQTTTSTILLSNLTRTVYDGSRQRIPISGETKKNKIVEKTLGIFRATGPPTARGGKVELNWVGGALSTIDPEIAKASFCQRNSSLVRVPKTRLSLGHNQRMLSYAPRQPLGRSRHRDKSVKARMDGKCWSFFHGPTIWTDVSISYNPFREQRVSGINW
ncbi:LOW QUALITY PROTEIN: hypothetical protein V1478_017854 [Vespula squamosa]|uniref:Uncharacterized protein n=1 Tax=Vespula squamosa TaxID=30214 RepID=A0ABD1ZVE5_VESSQ